MGYDLPCSQCSAERAPCVGAAKTIPFKTKRLDHYHDSPNWCSHVALGWPS